MKFALIAITLVVVPAFAQAQTAPGTSAYPIAGLNPGQRPVEAPTIKEVERTKEREARFLYGISKPYPPNLGAPENWGNWFVPFDHPGMLGRYDIRGWHTEKNRSKLTGENKS